MRYSAGLLLTILWAQTSSWGNAQIDSARSIIPRYIVSPVTQNNTRLPYFAVLKLTNLRPNTTYRFVSRMDNSTTPPPSLNVNLGAGNPIFYNPATQTYSRVSSPSLSTAGSYGTITTDGNGEADLIFGLEPTSNPRFRTDGGNQVYIKVFLLSDSGPVDSAYVIGANTPIQPLSLRTFSNAADTTGSFLYDSSLAPPKSLVFLYDSYGPQQLGARPLSSAVVENAGISWPNTQLPAYTSEVSGKNGRYGTVIPNSSTGIKAIHYIDPNAPTLLCEQAIYDSDGIWPSGISTAAPTNGPSALGILNSPVYPLPSDPGNSCISVSSTDINPSTGKVYVNYTITPTSGFLYGAQLLLDGIRCTAGFGPLNLPINIPQADSTLPLQPYIYGLCQRSQWGTTIDSLQVSWFHTGCEPCIWYQPVQGTFIWRCFRNEGGIAVRNFTYYGSETDLTTGAFYSTASVTLHPRRVPKKVKWTTPPAPAAQAGTSFNVVVELEDNLTGATWGASFGAPSFTGCNFSPGTLRILDANDNSVVTLPFSWMNTTGGMPFAQISGTWPTTPGQYRVVVEAVPFPSCSCPASGVSGWAASDALPVTLSPTTALIVLPEADAWRVSLPEAQGSIHLYDNQGRLIWETPVEGASLSIPRAALPNGIYTLVWRSGDSLQTQKLIHMNP
ncbi:MAG: T9SS type A sorting domain-containing protein [Bacteroidia bacterium]|nr:T9SS type A sorting domain-containing protein [Bacteroidia bacterium]MDW8058103.1 T9SS type A sorting domain-containing protein [Bacteroidia bacterium]